MGWVQIIVAVLGSSGLFAFLTHLLDMRSGRRDKLDAIANDVRESKVALVRLQLLNLIQHSPTMHAEILDVAHCYFVELGGNWYTETVFTEWAGEQGVPLPSWFKE